MEAVINLARALQGSGQALGGLNVLAPNLAVHIHMGQASHQQQELQEQQEQ